MKKITLLGLLLASTLFAQAQTKTDSIAVKKSSATTQNGNNEIKLNVLYSILGIPEITYERIINDESAAGLSVLVGITDDSNFDFGVIPYYRVYFGAKKASGFFIEANTAVITSNSYYLEYYSTPTGYQSHTSTSNRQTNFGLGAAAGGKFLTKSGFIGEAYFGLGRLFGNSDDEIYPRLGITIGKRF